MTEKQIKEQFERALRARDAGRVDECVRLLRSLFGELPNNKAVVGTLGVVLLYEKGDPKGALPVLRQSVSMSPNSEVASLGLFHALVELDMMKDAGDEADRFLETNESSEYRTLLSEFPADWRKV